MVIFFQFSVILLSDLKPLVVFEAFWDRPEYHAAVRAAFFWTDNLKFPPCGDENSHARQLNKLMSSNNYPFLLKVFFLGSDHEKVGFQF